MTIKPKCGNCAYYERAPLRAKGWCRNGELFKPNENHLVEESEYSCFKTFGSHWELSDSDDANADPGAPRHRWRLPTEAERAQMEEEEAARAISPRRDSKEGAGGPTRRLLAVAAAVVAVVALFLIVRAVLFEDEEATAQTEPTVTITATSTPQATASPTATEPTTTLTPIPTITVGVKAQVTNTSAAGLKLRDGPSTASPVVRQLSEGALLDVVGGPAEADGHTWWQVSIDGTTGWCAGDWLTLVTAQP